MCLFDIYGIVKVILGNTNLDLSIPRSRSKNYDDSGKKDRKNRRRKGR